MFSGFADDLQNMGALHFYIFAGVAAALVLYLFYLIWRNLNRARIIEDTPTAKIRSAPQGYVELEGSARQLPDQPINSPLTNTPCVWYRFKIEKERHSNSRKAASHWEEVESGVSEQPFLFFDGTGECLVDPRGAEVTAGVRKVWYGNSKWPGIGQRRGLLGTILGRRYRYTEERIDVGSLYALGWFGTLRSTDTAVNEEVSNLLRAWKQDQAGLKRRFDSNQDGVIDEQEWRQARQVAQREVIQDRARRSSQADVHYLRATQHNGYPYLISAKPQFQLVERHRRHAVLSLIGSVTATAVLTWMLLVRFQH